MIRVNFGSPELPDYTSIFFVNLPKLYLLCFLGVYILIPPGRYVPVNILNIDK